MKIRRARSGERGIKEIPSLPELAPASASKTNNFSNDGSIIGRRGPGFCRIIHALRRSISKRCSGGSLDKLPPTLFFSGSWNSSTTPQASNGSNFQQAQPPAAGESAMPLLPL
jgi:hypothetical protein